MGTLSSILQFVAVLLIILFIFSFIRLIISVLRSRRLEGYAVVSQETAYSFEYHFFVIVHKITVFLKRLVIFNTVCKTYDKYVTSDSDKITTSMDFLSMKFIVGFMFMCLYFISVFLYKSEIQLLMTLIIATIGFLIPDIVYKIRFGKSKKITSAYLLRAVIIMNNSFKANKSIEQAVSDVIRKLDGDITIEFKKILNDVKLGIDMGSAFKRMYYRTKMPTVLKMANIISLINSSGANVISVFETVEKEIVKEENLKHELLTIRRFNKLIAIISLIVPIVFFISIIIYNPYYYDLIFSEYGYAIIGCAVIMYILYFFVVRRIAKEDLYER